MPIPPRVSAVALRTPDLARATAFYVGLGWELSPASTAATISGSIGSAPPDQKRETGRLANELKQAIEARWEQYQAARDTADREANKLAEIYWLANQLPESEGR